MKTIKTKNQYLIKNLIISGTEMSPCVGQKGMHIFLIKYYVKCSFNNNLTYV